MGVGAAAFEEIAHELITALLTKFGISSDLLACMRDRASVNNVAVRFLSIECFHTPLPDGGVSGKCYTK